VNEATNTREKIFALLTAVMFETTKITSTLIY